MRILFAVGCCCSVQADLARSCLLFGKGTSGGRQPKILSGRVRSAAATADSCASLHAPCLQLTLGVEGPSRWISRGRIRPICEVELNTVRQEAQGSLSLSKEHGDSTRSRRSGPRSHRTRDNCHLARLPFRYDGGWTRSAEPGAEGL